MSLSVEPCPSKKNKSCFPAWSSVPGKTFLLGEYAVLFGYPALVAALPPRFLLELRAGPKGSFPFHRESPAGKWIQGHPSPWISEYEIHFTDPYQAQGGFGASTAQFAALAALDLANRFLDLSSEWNRVWLHYRKLVGRVGSLMPSGADLVAQWLGGTIEFTQANGNAQVRSLPPPKGFHALFFSATHQPTRKIRTHEHLHFLQGEHGLAAGDFLGASRWLTQGARALAGSDAQTFGESLTGYAESLASLGLEVPQARADRLTFAALPEVLGAKGCGAGLADSVLVVVRAEADIPEVVRRAAERDLVLVHSLWPNENGVKTDESI